MDREELKERCCSKCLRCFDEYSHYSWLSFIPVTQPQSDDSRYYCNKEHKYVFPDCVKHCFEER